VGHGPPEGGQGIVHRGRKRVLGRQAVVDREDLDLGVVAEDPAWLVMGVQIADHKAPAVQEHQQRLSLGSPRPGRPVVAGAQRVGAASHLKLANAAHLGLEKRVDERLAMHPHPHLAGLRVSPGRPDQSRIAPQLKRSERELDPGIERLAVELHLRAAGQA
jgi:hypothetical protein